MIGSEVILCLEVTMLSSLQLLRCSLELILSGLHLLLSRIEL